EHAACTGRREGQCGSKAIDERAGVPIRQGQRGEQAPGGKARNGCDKKLQPMPRQCAVASQQAAIETMPAQRKTYEEIKKIGERPTELNRERAKAGPVPSRKRQRKRHISERRDRNEGDKKGQCMIIKPPDEAAQAIQPLRREYLQRGRDSCEHGELTQKPG